MNENKKEITLPLIEPRDYQINVLKALDSGFKRVAWILHRRGGKDLIVFNWIIKSLMEKKQLCFYFLPTYSQAKKVIWQGVTKAGMRFLDYIPKEIIAKKSEVDLAIEFVSGSRLQLIGAENYDRIMGTAPQIVVFSEAALQSKAPWNFIRPILTENDGTAIFVSTPRGRNWFYDLYQMAKNDENWFTERLTVEDTKAISLDAIDKERKAGMSEDLIQQEFYVSFNRGVEGSYYNRYMERADQENRISNVPLDPTAKVFTAWDLGISDSTVIIFFQLIGNEIHIIDSYENNGEALSHYANVLKDKGYLYGDHYAPHDIQNRELGTGLSRLSVAQSLGINFVVLPTLKIPIIDGIEIVRGLFPRFWIDKNKNQQLIKALQNYRKEYDENRNVYKDRPVHDEHSHFCDGIRYASIAIKANMQQGSGPSDQEADALFQKYIPCFN